MSISEVNYVDAANRFTDYSTRGLVEYAVEMLDESDIILKDGDTDYAAADLLRVLGVMHDETGIDIETLPEVRHFAITLLHGAGWME